MFGDVVFPKSEDAPAGFTQGSSHKPVARPIGGEFLHPKLAVVCGHVGMLWAAVPETAVHENGVVGGCWVI